MYIVIIILSFLFSHYLYNAAFDSILIKKLMMMTALDPELFFFTFQQCNIFYVIKILLKKW